MASSRHSPGAGQIDQGAAPAAAPKPAGASNGLRDRIAPIVAVALLAVFAAALGAMFIQLGLPQQQWDRAVYLLNGVEGVAFAAAGYLFGKEVHRQRADAAEEQAEEQQKRAQGAEREATKGRELSGIVKGAAAATRRGALEGLDESAEPSSLQALAAEARRLFPDEPRNPA
jgi:hypothetical protein